MLLKKILVGSVFVLLNMNVYANRDDNDTEKEGVSFTLGVGVSNETSIYNDADDGIEVLPFFAIEWGRYFLMGPRLGTYLYGNEQWSVTASIGLDEAGDVDRGDGSELDDMGDLDNVFSGQIQTGFETDWGEIEFTLAKDISNKHDGYRVVMAYGYPFHLGQWMVEPTIEIEWLSEEINQYFYGVTEAYVKPGRALYEPDSGINYGLEISGSYPINQNHMIQLSAGYTKYSREVQDSPIVNRSSSTEIGIGYIYRF